VWEDDYVCILFWYKYCVAHGIMAVPPNGQEPSTIDLSRETTHARRFASQYDDGIAHDLILKLQPMEVWVKMAVREIIPVQVECTPS
jgi:hypothetical protein